MSATTNPAPSDRGTVPVLVARDLGRHFGAVHAVAGVSLRVQAGELYGLVGPDGAGKTTAIRLMTGLLRPAHGEARVLGLSVGDGSLAVREAIGYMPQQYSLYGDLSVAENLRFFGRLFGIPRRERAKRQERLLAMARLSAFHDRRADALSGGMYKKLALSCALLHRPQLLVLDEPTNGVDPVSRRDLWDLLYELVSDGMAVLLATPYMDEAARCHRVGLMNEGRLLAQGRPSDLVAAFVHEVVRVRAEDRFVAEELLSDRREVLALSPQGPDLRLVVRRGAVSELAEWAKAAMPSLDFAPAQPDFEDVFLALLQDPESVAAESCDG